MVTLAEQPIKESVYLPTIAKIEKIISYTELEKCFRIVLPNGMDLGHKPGQFVQVWIPNIGEAPISICSSPTEKGYFDLTVRKMGSVTTALHNLKDGDEVGIRGPYGKGFPGEEAKGNDILFIAGGIGLAPLRSLINYIRDNRSEYKKVTILYGSKTSKELLFLDDIKVWKEKHNIDVKITVDRGDSNWTGNVGVVTTLFKDLSIDADNTFTFVCGPPIMYKFVILGLRKFKLPGEKIILSLERQMKCGIGKCGHCQINDKYVCKDGPDFRLSELKHLEEAL